MEQIPTTEQPPGGEEHAYVLMTHHVHLLRTPHSLKTPSMLLASEDRVYMALSDTPLARLNPTYI